MTATRVVVADDQALVRTGFRMILTADGIHVVAEATTGAEAVDAVRRTRPDVVLMDIRMPEMDGLEATRRIVAAGPDGPRVVILTTFDLDRYVYAALSAGASGFLLKDVTPEQLTAAVRLVRAGDALLAPSITRRLVERFARRDEGAAAVHRDLGGLTPRELEVLLLLARGLSNAELARRLQVSEATVKTHVARILGKLQLRDRAQAVVLAYETGLVAPGEDGIGRRRIGSVAVRVLVVGGGAREHALCLALAADPAVTALVCAPGNAGTAMVAEQRPLAVDDAEAVAALAAEVRADLVVIGPEVPLVAGAADAVRARGIACFGPGAAAARLEGSKAFAKDVMTAAGVPTAGARVCSSPAEAGAALDEFGPPYVVKDDGLAAGKGVLVTPDRDAALAHAAACGTVVIEEFLDGPEVSLFCLTDGTDVRALLPAQDFKRAGDGDTGPNTGGMGAYAPLDWAPPTLVEDVLASVVRPTLAEMTRRGTPFAGLLYVGLALGARGPRVVEFNARFGDPETQVVLALLETPLAGLLHAAATGTLAAQPPLRWRDGYAVTVVLAALGYPAAPRGGDVITGADLPGVLHAGTRRRDDGAVVSAGGRVLSVLGVADDLPAARDAAYALLGRIHLDGAHFRTDIAGTAAAARSV